MKNIFKILILSILLAQIPNECSAQDSVDNRKIFISIHSGAFFPSWGEFKDVYHSPCAFINGISLGIPFTNKGFFVYAKGMYFQKSGTPIVYHFEYNDLTGEVTTWTTQEGECKYQQWLGNIGIQYNLNLGLANILMFNGGITLFQQSYKIKNSTAGSEAKGFNGLFMGIGYEKRILRKIGLFSEAQYNFDVRRFKILDYEIRLKYGGANVNVGMKYYF